MKGKTVVFTLAVLIATIVLMRTAAVAIQGGAAAASPAGGIPQAIPQPVFVHDPLADPNVHGTINGMVKLLDSSQGVRDVQVTMSGRTIDGIPTGYQRRTITDADGRFSFADVPGGHYSFIGNRDGYFPDPVTVFQNVNATLTRDLPNAQVSIPLIAGGSISGTIRDAQGRPLANVPVIPLRIGYFEGKRIYGDDTKAQTTNDHGEYRLFGLYPAEYAVRTNAGIGAPRFKPTTASSQPQLTFYPGTRDFSHAAPLVLHSGEDITGIDFAAEFAPAYTVSGKVRILVPGGRKLNNGQIERSITSITIVPQNASPVDFSSISNSTSAADPDLVEYDFELHGITPGAYTLFPSFYDGSVSYRARMAVDVTDHDVEGLRADIRAYPDVTFRVTPKDLFPANTSAFDFPSLFPFLRSLDGPSNGSDLKYQTQSDGAIVVPNLSPGKYRIHPNYFPMDFYLADIRQGALSLYNDGILTVTGEASYPVEFVFRKGGGEIHGTLQNRQGKPVKGAAILVPSPPRRDNVALYRGVGVAADGQFEVRNIAPGDYKIFAWESPPPDGAEESAEYLAQYEGRGKTVIVSAGVSASDIVVDLIPKTK